MMMLKQEHQTRFGRPIMLLTLSFPFTPRKQEKTLPTAIRNITISSAAPQYFPNLNCVALCGPDHPQYERRPINQNLKTIPGYH